MAPRSNKSTFVSPRNKGGRVRSGSNTDTSAKADAGGGQAEQVRAELGLGAYTAAVGTTAAIGAGIAAVRSGAVGRAVNKIGDKTVLLHGSPTSGLRSIEPRVPPKGPNAGKGAKVYGMRTDTDPIKQKIWGPLHTPGKDLSSSIKASIGYARGTSSWLKPKTGPNQGSVYVIRTPRKTTDLSTELVERGIIATGSTSRGKVVTEIQLGTKSQEQIVKEIQKGLRRAGVKVPKKK